MQTWQIITGIVVVLVLIGALVWVQYNRHRSRRLQARFGPEYDRTVKKFGNRRLAESNLRRRVARVSQLDIHPLTLTEGRRFEAEWKACQAHFVDNPVEAVYEAEKIIHEMMRTRGHRATDAVERFEDVTATHPNVAIDYREASELLGRHRRGEASTEDMRQAMVHYRKVFSELLEGGQHEEFERAA